MPCSPWVPLGGPFGLFGLVSRAFPLPLGARLPLRGLRGQALVDNLLEDDDPKVPLTGEMYNFKS